MKPVRVHEDAELRREQLLRAARSSHRHGRPGRAPGSISVRSGEAVVITTGDPHEDAAEQGAVMVDPEQGLPLLGETEWPPPETPAHLAVHRRLPGCGAVVHIPEPHPAALAALVGAGGGASSPVAVVASADGPALSRLRDDADVPPALLVEGAGLFTWGRDLDEALGRLERIEGLGLPLLPESACGADPAGVRTG